MYNRYTRNDGGTYTRMPQSDVPLPGGGRAGGKAQGSPPPESAPSPGPKPSSVPPPAPRPQREILNRLLEKLHLGDLDSGDLLVLLLLFLLFRENADEELLIALGLLLIL